jgi:phosphatidylinositol alpha-1,6-mannosyltransferase
MNILIATPFTLSGPGGSSRLLRDLVEYLLTRNHQVDIVLYWSEPEEREPTGILAKAKIHWIAPSRFGPTTLFATVRALAICAKRRPDVVLCWVAWTAAFVGYAVRRIFGVPFMIYTHGEDVTIARSSRKKEKFLRYLLPKAAYLMANSRFSLDQARMYGADPERSEWVPPFIDPAPYAAVLPEEVSALRTRLRVPDGRLILTVARLQPRKGHDTIVQALPRILKAVPDTYYLIIGKGDPKVLLGLAERVGVADRVHIVPHVTDSDLAHLYSVGDIYAMVSRVDPHTGEEEGFGIVYLEASASGRPCVAGSHGGCRDPVEDGVNGLVVDPESPVEVADAITRLLVDADLAREMGERGRVLVRERFSKDVVLPRFEKILDERRRSERAT